MNMHFKNKMVLITGGSTGIGLAVAEEFLKEEAGVIICARNQSKIDDAVNGMRKKYPGCEIYGKSCDVTKLDQIEELVGYVKSIGGIDILINNAGIGSEEKNLTAPDEKWYYYWDLHVMSAVRLARFLVPLMRKRPGEGVIINTCSICAMQPFYYEPIYNVTKAALHMYTKCLANELIQYNIRVLAISPGLVKTAGWYKAAEKVSKQEGITFDEYYKRIAQDMTPIGRFATVEEIAKFYVFLASENASYCFGTDIHIDAGALKTLA